MAWVLGSIPIAAIVEGRITGGRKRLATFSCRSSHGHFVLDRIRGISA